MESTYQFMKFSIVGASNTLATILTYSILVHYGVNFVIANIIGYSVGILNSYFWNSKWVFNSKFQPKAAIKFICVNLVVLSINTLLLYLLVKNIKMNAYISQLVVIVVGMAINFILNKVWTFR